VFVEVKSSSSFAYAIESLYAAQVRRIQTTALEFLDAHPDLTGLDLRVDLAAVDGMGRFRVIPNITM
jgi:putative endonuclease